MTIKTIMTATATAAVLASGAYAADPMVGGAAMSPEMNIVQNASKADNLTTLVAAVKAAGLVKTLEGKGPFTVFAPTNDAFAKLPAGTVDTLLKPANKAQLTKILKCHVVSGDVTSKALIGMIDKDGGSHMIDTLGGCKLTAKHDGDKITLSDEQNQKINVTIADVKQSNGEVHVIDTVILPAPKDQ